MARSFQSLVDMKRLPENSLAKLLLKCVIGYQVNGAPQELFKVFLQIQKAEKAWCCSKCYENIQITFRSGLIPGNGPEKGKGFHAQQAWGQALKIATCMVEDGGLLLIQTAQPAKLGESAGCR